MFILSVLPVVASFAAWFTPASATNQATCSNSTLSDFKITALYTDPALNAGLPAEGFPITSTFASVDHLTFYSVLTHSDCWTAWDSFKLNNGELQLWSSHLGWATESLHVNPGKSPVFKTDAYAQPGPNEWCAMRTDETTEPVGQSLPPLQLAVHNTPGLFYLCNNSNANGRRDLVFQSGATYEPQFSNCNKVTLFPTPLNTSPSPPR